MMVNDEYAGRTGQCRACKARITVGQPSHSPFGAASPVPPPVRDFSQPSIERMAPAPPKVSVSQPMASSDPLFSRDIFLLRQKHLAINEKYAVWDENGAAILFVERPAHLLRNLLALVGGLAAGGAIFTMLGVTFQMVPESIQSAYITAGSLLAIVVIIIVYVQLEMKRHVEFYRDESKSMKVLRVIQDKKFEIITASYTVTDADGKQIGTFRKNHLYDLIRKQWECRDRGGALLFVAREDSIIKSLLRRFFGPLLGLLRQNFIFCDPRNDVIIGIFNRSFTLLDRYVLDLSQDAGSRIDRRLALAMGVMLDTGERR
jgi:uncharacterized protein YxjI